jgi:hypothetical protein
MEELQLEGKCNREWKMSTKKILGGPAKAGAE